ncbi:MAG: hypothetical protein AAFX76_05965 [Planctomycetota bacterium]
MQIGAGDHTYRWHDNWAQLPDTPPNRNNGRTHAAAVLRDGRVVVFAQGVPGVLFYDAGGKLVGHWGDRFVGAHGLRLIEEDGEERFWLVDQESCEICKTTVDGELLQRLAPPPDEALGEGRKFIPTWADKNPANGDIWVGDGYGSGRYVYRYAADGTYLSRIDGSETGLPFAQPHGLAFSPEGELWITDRANHRVVVCDGEGMILRHKQQLCHSPTSFAFHGGLVYVAELFSGIKVITPDLELVADVGSHPDVKPNADPNGWWPPQAPEGWPNVAGTPHVRPGVSRSPPGIAVDRDGNVIVTEWIVGGRVTKLEKV